MCRFLGTWLSGGVVTGGFMLDSVFYNLNNPIIL